MERGPLQQNNQQIQGNGKIVVKASEILKKLKTYQDRKNFALENNWFLPKETGYDTSFMIEVLKGKKKYLPISMSAGFDLPYFRNGDTLNKNYIINKISGNEIYKEYIPEGIDLNKLSRKFILSMIAYLEPMLYKQLYSISKIKMGNKSLKKWEDYITEVKPEYYAKLNEYVAIENYGNTKRTKAFRLKKNGENTNIFTKINEVNIIQGEQNIQINQGNVMRINLHQNNNIINEIEQENNLDFE